MQKGNLKVLNVLMLALVTVALLSICTSVSAKVIDLPEGFKIIYYCRGSANIAVPSGWPSGGQPTTMLRIVATHIEAGNMGTSDTIFIYSYNPASSMGPWIPVAIFTTNADALAFYKIVWSGTPAAAPTNSKLISETVLNVERHGNRITAELTSPQTIMWTKASPPPSFISVTIPAFKMELNKVGCCLLTKISTTLTGYAGASGYTINDYQLGFNGKGVFSCQAWGYTTQPMTDCAIVMHGIRTYVPP